MRPVDHPEGKILPRRRVYRIGKKNEEKPFAKLAIAINEASTKPWAHPTPLGENGFQVFTSVSLRGLPAGTGSVPKRSFKQDWYIGIAVERASGFRFEANGG